jgi:methionyl aminopeptidase
MGHMNILTNQEIQEMKVSCKIAADTLLFVGENIKEGISTLELNDLVHRFIISKGATPSPLNYKGFPRSVCTSINNVVCHGIPSKKDILKSGDIINVDVTTYYPKENGFHGDTSATFYIGNVSDEAKLVVETAREALQKGIETVMPGNSIGCIGNVIEDFVRSKNCFPVENYVGHGVGRTFHSEPWIHHTKTSKYEQENIMPKMRPGMVFTIEPMVNLLSPEVNPCDDGWTVKTKINKDLSAQFEHTILVTETGYEILTLRDKILLNCENCF